MAEEGTLCTNADVLKKCGANVSATFSAEAYTNVYIKQAESYINAASGKNWNSVYSALTAAKKYILNEAASCLAACYAMVMDSSGYVDRVEAENIINFNYTRFVECLELLKIENVKTFLENA